MNRPEINHEFEHKVLEALTAAVPGFYHAYTHSAEFHALMRVEMDTLRMRVELMALGAQSRERQKELMVRRIENGLLDGR